MKRYLLGIIFLGLTSTVNASSASKYLSDNLVLVQENLNNELYSFKNKIIQFSISKNQELARLQILNNICPPILSKAAFLGCKAMPLTIVNVTFELSLTDTDQCNIRTYMSNQVATSDRSIQDQMQYTQIMVKDFSGSTCERAYPSDLKVDIKDVTMIPEFSHKPETYYSELFFNYEN